MRRISLRREEGVAMTEFALIVPVFLIIVVGFLAFGRIFFYWIEANHEANEAARWAAVDRNPYKTCASDPPTGAGGCQSLQQHALGGSTVEFQSNTEACIFFPGTSRTTATIGDRVKVDIRKPYRLRIGLPGFQPVDMGITIRGSATMRIERFDSGNDPVNYSDAAGHNIGTCTP